MKPDLKPARVILVDDHPAVSRQVAKLLPGEFEVVATLTDGQGLSAAIKAHQPDVIILDISMPGQSGIQVASQLRRESCAAKIIFLTVHNDPDYARAAFAGGGLAYVVKSRLATDLVPALRAVMAGKRYLSPCPELKDLENPNDQSTCQK